MLSLQQLQEKDEKYIKGYLDGLKNITCYLSNSFLEDKQYQKGYVEGFFEVTRYEKELEDKSFVFVCGFHKGLCCLGIDLEMLSFFRGTNDYLEGYILGSKLYKEQQDFYYILCKVDKIKKEQEARDYVRQNHHLFTPEVFSALGVQSYIEEQNKTKLKKKLTEMP